jgi:ABC-type Mn2+/Zn2+ transport system permease subunit
MSEYLEEVIDLLGYGFVQQAMIAGTFVAICCSILGVFLVLRRYSMIGDGLSHVAVGTLGFAVFMGWSPLVFSIPMVVLASLLIPVIAEKAKVFGDASIAMLSGVGLAIGVLFVSMGPGLAYGLENFLFGSILAITKMEVWISVGLSVGVIGTVCFFYHDLLASTFEPEHAKVLGIKTKWVDRLLLMVSGLTVVLAVRIVGAMLVTSLIVFPAVTALQVARGFRAVILTASFIGVSAVLVGMLASCFIRRCPSGPTIVLSSLVFFLVAYVVGKRKA